MGTVTDIKTRQLLEAENDSKKIISLSPAKPMWWKRDLEEYLEDQLEFKLDDRLPGMKAWVDIEVDIDNRLAKALIYIGMKPGILQVVFAAGIFAGAFVTTILSLIFYK